MKEDKKSFFGKLLEEIIKVLLEAVMCMFELPHVATGSRVCPRCNKGILVPEGATRAAAVTDGMLGMSVTVAPPTISLRLVCSRSCGHTEE